MTFPTVHLNGTSKESLLARYVEATDAVRSAIEMLCEAAPNGRDYYLQGPEVYQVAAAEHDLRVLKLRDVMNDLEDLAQHVAGLVRCKGTTVQHQ